MAVTFNKVQPFVEALALKKVNLGGSSLTLALTNAANAPVNTNGVLSQLVQVAYTYCSTRVCTLTSCVQAAGTLVLKLVDLVLTATGGAVGPFRYVVLYDDSATNDDLIGWYDYGSEITLAAGETLTIDFDGANGVLTLA
jgi:hypothetical protein